MIKCYFSHPVTAVTTNIEVEAETTTFRVRCTSTGGRALSMAVSGPNGYSSHLYNIEPVGIGNFQGSDNYTATTEVILNGRDGDVYQCNATGISSRTSVATVRGNCKECSD